MMSDWALGGLGQIGFEVSYPIDHADSPLEGPVWSAPVSDPDFLVTRARTGRRCSVPAMRGTTSSAVNIAVRMAERRLRPMPRHVELFGKN